jgi:hypothetical protein
MATKVFRINNIYLLRLKEMMWIVLELRISAYAIIAYHHWCCEFEFRSGWNVQHDVIKFVNDLRQVGGFLRVLRFPPPLKLLNSIGGVIITVHKASEVDRGFDQRQNN